MTNNQSTTDERDLVYLRQALEIARRARANGNHPFGALIVDENDQILVEAENTVNTEQDCTGHAETNLMRKASQAFPPEKLERSTLYTSTEPCAMCSGAVHWGRMGRVVFALSEATLYKKIGNERVDSEKSSSHDDDEALRIPCRKIFACSERPIEVMGPLIEEEAWMVHEGFWA